MKYSFKNDYAEGAHPRILEALLRTNLQQQNGYGLDEFSLAAEQLILNLSKSPNSRVHFVSGGTQANIIVISALLRPHESVIAADSGHIFTNETGAIEATGHKVHGVPTADGKLRTDDILKVLEQHTNKPHQVKQKIVYISNATEVGTFYTKRELQDLSDFCRRYNLYLFMDGARLGNALTATGNDLTLEDVASLTDVYYLGGTKNGALLGEAIVINNTEVQDEFGFHIKQKGGMLAKGRLLGIQFHELLRDNLYFDLALHANTQAMRIKEAFQEAGCTFLSDTYTNQIFPVLTNNQIDKLSANFDFYVWKKVSEEKSAIRIITSWATVEDSVDVFIREIEEMG
ncbi:aminotransferase class I/II-fold pyridoxal phosphate-dependent enzyme [Marnyiella aurantia]|uniref:Aminotransferase class I/II-fold pyridoxal phosphate-dependent enzyme n=1 Tax=Marnyiella aurantia TaxID=2758037 RepID=A0A7D7LMI4_9FLAO|nr:aminotransferase class I/II-fold pyridoxal phosphate-dependent enzyme [Marnyiella aurantia]MBA5246157.1 aminotransferase class I/II-fold pyridoxal phosphate-dependent enzyme [Marnyiella aurantia]QMS98459.1 aminotransferase class I/II-fold pyridoxal phosphate-dependent enzyme [Marnyiella aurantia]